MPFGPNNGNIDFSAMRILVELWKLGLGGNTDLCLSQEGVCGAAGGRWVTGRLQGSDPLNLCPNSISPSIISLPLSDIISQAKQDSHTMPTLEKIATHTLPVLTLLPFTRLCTRIGGWLSRHNWALCTRIILRECKPVFEELMLHWCLVAMGLGLRPWHNGMTFLFSCIVTYWVDTNYPAFRSTNLAATYWAGVKPSPFMWCIFWSGCRLWDFSTKRLDARGGNVKGGEFGTMDPP